MELLDIMDYFFTHRNKPLSDQCKNIFPALVDVTVCHNKAEEKS